MRKRRRDSEPIAEPIIRDSGASAKEMSIVGQYAAGRDIAIAKHLGPPPQALKQLPPATPHFTGRKRELAHIGEILVQGKMVAPGVSRVVLIVGKPGVGKSALAIQLAHRLRPHFVDAQLYENLRSPDGTPVLREEVLGRVLRKLGVSEEHIPPTVDERAALYRSLLDQKRVLVLLDNASSKEQVELLIPGSINSAVVITAQTWLGDVEGTYAFGLEVLGSDDCLELLGRLSGEARITGELEASRRIIDLCGGLPLAVRIAGGLLQSPARAEWPVREFAERLADEHTRLNELQLGDLSVRATFALSYGALSSEEAKLLRSMSLLPGPDFAAPLAAAASSLTTEHTETLLEDLANAQLLEVIGVRRYGFHELLRIFAREAAERSETAPQRTTVVQQATKWYIEWAAASQAVIEKTTGSHRRRETAEREGAFAWFASEWANIMATIDDCYRRRGWDDVFRLTDAVYDFLGLQGHREDWQRVLELAVDAARQKKDKWRTAQMLVNLAIVYHHRSRWTDARRSFDEGLALMRKLGDKDGLARALYNFGTMCAAAGQPGQAERCFEESLALRRAVGDREGEERTIHARDALRAMIEQDKPFFFQVGETRGKLVQKVASLTTAERSELDSELVGFEKELRAARIRGDRAIEASVLYNIGRLKTSLESWAAATDALEHSIAISESIGDTALHGLALSQLAVVYGIQGHVNEAEEAYKRSLPMLQRSGNRRAEAVTRNSLGALYAGQGRYADAVHLFQRALALSREAGIPEEEELIRRNLQGAMRDQARPKRFRRLGRIVARLRMSIRRSE